MHKIIYIFFVLMITLTGCKTSSYFHTPNDVFKVNATIHLLNGTEKTGKISIQFETGLIAANYILLYNDNIEEKISIVTINYYTLNGDDYYPKEVDIDLNGIERLLFVKRISPENSRISLYELMQQAKKTDENRTVFNYFVSFPNQDRLEAYNTWSKKFMPNFDDKVSRLFNDCPQLALKIAQKEKGYYLGQFTLSDQKKVSVWKTIIDDYNKCKQ